MAAGKTRDRLVDVGTRLFMERGYHQTGIQDVLAEAKVPKGSFYHYFRSKEEFGLEVVNRYGRETLETLDRLFDDPSKSPLERVRGFFAMAFAEWKDAGCRYGCLMGNLGQELADAHEPFRAAIGHHLEAWAGRIGQCLKEAVDRGELPPDTDPELLGKLLIDGFQGAALRMKLERRPNPLDRFLSHFLPPPRAA